MPKLNDTFKLQVENLALRKEIEKLTEEISSLRNQLSKIEIPSSPITFDSTISDEEIILINQIKRLRERIEGGKELTLEDVKKLDILIKNKRQINNDPEEKSEQSPDLSDDNLILIASSKPEK